MSLCVFVCVGVGLALPGREQEGSVRLKSLSENWRGPRLTWPYNILEVLEVLEVER